MKNGSRTIDWDAIETAYVTGNESQRAIAARFGVIHQEVSKHSKIGGWVQKRKDFRATAMANALQKALRAREEEIAEGLRGTDLVNKRALEMLEASNFLEYIVSTKSPCREMESISKVFINTEEARRLLRGLMKPSEEEKAKLEREKWEHEIKREQDEETGKGTVIVEFEGELEDYAT